MRNLLKKEEKGFTLIEIVLVLAIAGLLLVIVFLAVSGAQKSRRDTQRKNDNARLLAQVEACASNNTGTYNIAPCNAGGSYTTVGGTTGSYSPNNFKDPKSGADYAVTVTTAFTAANACAADGSDAGKMYLEIPATTRTVIARACLEQGFQDLTNK